MPSGGACIVDKTGKAAVFKLVSSSLSLLWGGLRVRS